MALCSFVFIIVVNVCYQITGIASLNKAIYYTYSVFMLMLYNII